MSSHKVSRVRLVSRGCLSLLLGAAGVLHVISPQLFDAAIPFPLKLEINIAAGILECVLAVALWVPKFQDRAALATAAWFLVLTPIHLYVSWYRIPMFGFDHPAILWGRTVLQGGLYFWALSLQNRGWLMSQRWSDVVFLHYVVDPHELQKKVPFPLDLREGQGIVSIVPFTMSRIRFPFLPAVPGLSTLLELNLRTYVRVNGVPGVYFFTLDSNHLPGVLIARWFFALPYRWIKMSFSLGRHYEFQSPQIHLSVRLGDQKPSDELDQWLTERYSLFTKRGRVVYRGIVEHAPWSLRAVEVLELKDRFSEMIGDQLKLREVLRATYAEVLDVRFRPFRRV